MEEEETTGWKYNVRICYTGRPLWLRQHTEKRQCYLQWHQKICMQKLVVACFFWQTRCTYAETGAVSDTSFLPTSSSTDSHCWFGEMTTGCGPSVMLLLPNTLWRNISTIRLLRWATVWPIDMGRKVWGEVLCPFPLGALGLHLLLTQCGMGRGLPPYQVAS